MLCKKTTKIKLILSNMNKIKRRLRKRSMNLDMLVEMMRLWYSKQMTTRKSLRNNLIHLTVQRRKKKSKNRLLTTKKSKSMTTKWIRMPASIT